MRSLANRLNCRLQLVAFVVGLAAPLRAADPPKPYLAASADDMAWWREARFGMFVHWGPVSLKGTEIGWSRGGERRGVKKGETGPIPVEVYDNLYKQFNPVKFDARAWVAIAKAAGMRYLVFTTKHHDGFCMFDSQLTDYKITNSPFGRDVVKELADACHEGGLRLGFYYSPPDFHHPDYRTENHARYIAYLHGQLRELCSNYGQVDLIWFDGLGGKSQDWDSENLVKEIRALQPHVIINNRGGLPGDYDTPEQRVGEFRTDRAWETCMTICRQWAWKPDDQMKPLQQCLQTLVKVVGGDGNFLFNVGPMPTGEIEPRQVERLKEMGDWLRKYGETIYGARGGPFRPGSWGAATCKGNTAYVHIFEWRDGRALLPPLDRKIVANTVLTGGSAKVAQTERGIEIDMPAADRQPIDTTIALQLDGPAFTAKIGESIWESLTKGKKAMASNVFQQNRNYAAAKAVDDDRATRWATDAIVTSATLEVDLGTARTFDRAFISEEFDRVSAFELQYKNGAAWRTFATGERLGREWTRTFDPVTARNVRLNILGSKGGPTIWEFQLFAPDSAKPLKNPS